jgi:hypothetical protein
MPFLRIVDVESSAAVRVVCVDKPYASGGNEWWEEVDTVARA